MVPPTLKGLMKKKLVDTELNFHDKGKKKK